MISLIGSFFLLPSRVPTLAHTMSVETSTTVLSQLPTSQLHQIAQAITVKVYVGDTSGSGTLIEHQGQVYTVLTNAHVVTRGNSYRIQTLDGKVHQATLKTYGNAPNTDLALLEFSASESYHTASLNLDSNLSFQQPVYAAGFPFDHSDLVINNGQISFISSQPIRGGYQIGFTNQIVQGMSGGALLDSYGRVIGILGLRKFPVLNTVYTYQDGTVPEPKTLQKMRQYSFAVPIKYLRAIQPQTSLTKDQNKSTKLL